LATEVTRLVHGQEGLDASQRISEALFSGELSHLTESDFEQLRLDGLPGTYIEESKSGLVDALVSTGLAKSNRVAREFISNNAVAINGEKCDDLEAQLTSEQALFGKYVLLKRGKKMFHLLTFAGV
jgi:tyrosyl-tRNA synthetase